MTQLWTKKQEKIERQERGILWDLTNRIHTSNSVAITWAMFPDHLREKAQQRCMKDLEGAVENARRNLPVIIQNTRLCDIEISERQEQQYYRIAMYKAYNIRDELLFAKRVFGDPLPLEILIDILDQRPEPKERHGYIHKRIQGEIHAVLECIDKEDESAIKTLMEVAAKHGRYRQMSNLWMESRKATTATMFDAPENIVRTCYEAHRTLKYYSASDLTNMCIILKDWKRGNEFIEEWQFNDNLKLYAGWIALAMLQDLKQEYEGNPLSPFTQWQDYEE